MESFVREFFGNFSTLIIFVHVASTLMLIGGLFVVSFLAKPIIYEIKIPRIKYGKSIELLKKFLLFALIFMVLTILSGFVIVVGLNFAGGNPATNVIVHTIEALIFFACINFVYIYLKYKEAYKYYQRDENIQTHENLELIFRYIFPLNFILGIASIYLSIILGQQ